jgi:hypothetical protein
VDINKEPKPTRFNSSCRIKETVITTNFSIDNMATGVQLYIYYSLVGVSKEPIPPKLNSLNNIGATATPSSVSVLN